VSRDSFSININTPFDDGCSIQFHFIMILILSGNSIRSLPSAHLLSPGFFFLPAFFAHAEEVDSVARYSEIAQRFRAFVYPGILRHLEIPDNPARLAYKMIVRSGFRIIAISGAPERQLPNMALINENIQISIDGSQAQGRYFLLEPVIDPIGRRMNISLLNDCKHSFTLFASTVVHRELISNSYYY
jgi:hypothetical protein